MTRSSRDLRGWDGAQRMLGKPAQSLVVAGAVERFLLPQGDLEVRRTDPQSRQINDVEPVDRSEPELELDGRLDYGGGQRVDEVPDIADLHTRRLALKAESQNGQGVVQQVLAEGPCREIAQDATVDGHDAPE